MGDMPQLFVVIFCDRKR